MDLDAWRPEQTDLRSPEGRSLAGDLDRHAAVGWTVIAVAVAGSLALLDVEASRVGRDHVASTVSTLILAYAGASLPPPPVLVQGLQPIGRLLAGEVVAIEIVRMLVGSVGLVLSVPITTVVAAVALSADDTGAHAGDHHSQPPPRRRCMRDPWSDIPRDDGKY
jgi:YibE/F-like protein